MAGGAGPSRGLLGGEGGGEGVRTARRSQPEEAALWSAAGEGCSTSASTPQQSSCPGGTGRPPSSWSRPHAPACGNTRACSPKNLQAI
eukprot:5359057-Pleurochrysis_carterae.AAC.1